MGPGFEARLSECEEPLREMLAYLRSSAQHSGTDVTPRRYRHPKPNTGWGITYYRGESAFCDFHPKRTKGHVWGFIHDADSKAIERDGFQPSEQASWFQIRTMPEAVRFVKWILWGYDRRA